MNKKLLIGLLVVCILGAGVFFMNRNQGSPDSGQETVTQESDTAEEAGTEGTLAESLEETESEPAQDLKDETLSQDNEDFIGQISDMRQENDGDKEFVPDVIVNPEEGSVIVGDQIAEDSVTGESGNEQIDGEVLEELLGDTGLEIPEGDKVSLDDLADANDIEVESREDGTLVLSDPYQTCRIIVHSKEVLTDDTAVSVAGPFNDMYVFQYEDSAAAQKACEAWSKDPRVEFAEPEKVIPTNTGKASDRAEREAKAAAAAKKKIKKASSTGYFSYKNFDTWGTEACGFDKMKKVAKASYGGSMDKAPKVKVAVIDSGIDYDHPWFKKRLLSKGYDFVNGDKYAWDDYMHGTACAGIVAQNTTKNVKILPLKAGDDEGSLSNLDIYNALEYCISKKVDIVSMSFGLLSPFYSDLMKAGIDDAYDAGLILIAAYGNDGVKTRDFTPACFKNVIGVSAISYDKKKASFSNYGKDVDICAPGVSILCAVPEFYAYGGYAYLSGTSMSTPYVAAAAAMIKTTHPKYNRKQITKALYRKVKDYGPDGWDKKYGHGMTYLKKEKVKNLKSYNRS